MSNPYGGGPDRHRPISGWAVAIGIVLGLVATFVWMFIVFFVAYGALEDSGSSTVTDGVVFVLFLLPLPTAILLLCFRATRQAAAGFVMGLAIGTLVIAGLCSSLIIPGITA